MGLGAGNATIARAYIAKLCSRPPGRRGHDTRTDANGDTYTEDIDNDDNSNDENRCASRRPRRVGRSGSGDEEMGVMMTYLSASQAVGFILGPVFGLALAPLSLDFGHGVVLDKTTSPGTFYHDVFLPSIIVSYFINF